MNFLHKIPIFFFSLFYPMKVYGKENIPDGGCIFASNHFRAIDCGFIARIYGKDIKFLAKQELFKNKLFAKIVKSYGAIPINRDNPDMKSLLQAIKTIKNGHKLCIFVEGTRNKTGTSELQEIKGGTVIFAVKAKCPVVPLMIDRKSRVFRTTRIILGKPFYLDEFYDKKLTDEEIAKMGEIVKNNMLEAQRELNEILAKKKNKKK